MTDSIPEHKCGKVLDYCVYEDTKIFFCIFCKKVTGAAKESAIQVTINLDDDIEMNQYHESNLVEWK